MAKGEGPREKGWDRISDHVRPREAARDVQPSEELVAEARMRYREIELTAELERARAEEAAFEERYGATFDEFQAQFDPVADADLSEYYLEWSQAAEKVRMLRHQLARLAARGTRRTRATGAGDKPGEPPSDRGRMS